MPSIQERNIGAQFDILSRAVASRFHDLNTRPNYNRATYQAYVTDYNQLARYARTYSNIPYVARQWAVEQPRIGWTLKALESKVIDTSGRRLDAQGNEYFSPSYSPSGYTPVNYTPGIFTDGDVSIGKKGCCGCSNKSSLPTYGTTPTVIQQRPNTIFSGGNSTGGIPSFGDMLRDLFGLKPQTAPMISGDYPDSKLLDESGIFTGVITALIIGGIMFAIHQATKNK